MVLQYVLINLSAFTKLKGLKRPYTVLLISQKVAAKVSNYLQFFANLPQVDQSCYQIRISVSSKNIFAMRKKKCFKRSSSSDEVPQIFTESTRSLYSVVSSILEYFKQVVLTLKILPEDYAESVTVIHIICSQLTNHTCVDSDELAKQTLFLENRNLSDTGV